MAAHVPVMLGQVLRWLAPSPGQRVVDGTVGLGGHAERILERLQPGGLLIGLDRDPEMLERARARLERFGDSVRLVRARLSHLRDALEGAGLAPVDGVLMDLGICSAQLDDPSRGLSFRAGDGPDDAAAPLDMRLDRSRGETAAELIDRLDEEELARLLREGGVPGPRRVARALVSHRPLRSVHELREALREVRLPRRRHHPATLVFQALRIAVNGELEELERALDAALDVLASGGRLVVIAYHSGEDRRVKEFMRREERGCICPPDLPACGCGREPRLRILCRGEGPDADEVRINPRARSARLRAAEKH
jgi:16S rRNA (cytosine1402-N4)-methyltransferase